MCVMVVALANDEADLVRFFDDLLFPLPSAPLRRRPEDDVDVGEKLVTRNKAESSAPNSSQRSQQGCFSPAF